MLEFRKSTFYLMFVFLLLCAVGFTGASGSPAGACFNDAGLPGPCGPGFEQCRPAPFPNKPQFHIMDRTCVENDATAPFYDVAHGLYHYFFAVHPGGGGKVKRHVVSRDLVHWAYLPIPFWPGPEPYDKRGIITGSTTVVDGRPIFVYPGLCDAKDGSWPHCSTGTLLALAVPSNDSDPLYVNWTKAGVIVNNTARDPSTAWQDAATGEWRLTTYGGVVYGSMDFKTWYVSKGNSGFHPGECPSFFPIPPTSPHSRLDLISHSPPTFTHVNKYSINGMDWMAWGNYTSGPIGSSGAFVSHGFMKIDWGGHHYYASKDLWDPVKKRRINWGWAKSVGADIQGSHDRFQSYVTFPEGSAQTLAREVLWDPAIQQLVSPPLEEQAQLRGAKLASMENTIVRPGQTITFGPMSSGSGNQSETFVAFQIPTRSTSTPQGGSTRFGVVVMGGPDVGKSSGLFIYADYKDPPVNATKGDVYKVDVGVVDLKKSPGSEAPSHSVLQENDALAQLPLLVGESKLTLQVYVDHTFAEAFWQDGRVAMTIPVTVNHEAAIAVQVGSAFDNGAPAAAPITVESADVWEVESIWVSPEEILRKPRSDEKLLVV